MKPERFLALIVLLAALLVPVSAQNNTTTDPNNQNNTGTTDSQSGNRFWEVNVGGGNYMVALSSITSISKHRYVIDGTLLVDEVVVDTNGQSLVRFYYISPVSDDAKGTGVGRSVARIADRGKEVLEQAADRTGSQVHNMVVKTYPQTTHAKQVEYRVLSAEALSTLYSSVKRAWESGRGRVCNIR